MTVALRAVQRLILLFVVAALVAAALLHATARHEPRLTDAAGCFFDPTAPAWETTTGDGLCHTGPHAVQED